MGTFKFDDTFPSMSTFDFVELLEKHGFRLGYEMPEIHGYMHEKISKRIYYQPEQKMVACVTVPENEYSDYNHLNYFAGTVYTQRDSRPKEVLSLSDSSGPFFDSTDGYHLEKDIRDNVFKWYDSVVAQTQPLPEMLPDTGSSLKLMHMFNSNAQIHFSRDCPGVEDWQHMSFYGAFRDIAAFYNMSQIQDEGLKQMLSKVMEAMPARVEEAIFEVLNGDFVRPHERNEAALSWLMEQMGIDQVWFWERGVDVELALQPPKAFTIEFTIADPDQVLSKNRADLFVFFDNTVREFKEKTGVDISTQKSWNILNGGTLVYYMEHMKTHMDERKAAQILQGILREKGLLATVKKPPLQAQMAAAEAKRQEQKNDHTPQRTPVLHDQERS